MNVRFHVDEHVPNAVIDQLRARSTDVSTPADVGLSGADDEEQMAFAVSQQRIIITRDQDFLRLHGQGERHCGIIFYRDRPRIVGGLVRVLTALHERREAEWMFGRVEYL